MSPGRRVVVGTDTLIRYLLMPLALVVLALLGSCGAVPGVNPDASGERVLRFGLTADYPPFASRDSQGRLTGADVEAARRVARALGAQPEFVLTTWPLLERDFSDGRFDVALGGLTVTRERAAIGTYSRTLLHDGKRALVRCADRNHFPTPQSLDSPTVRVAINRGPSMSGVAHDFFPRATLVVIPDDGTLVAALLRGEVDAWVTDGAGVDLMARRHAGMLCASTQKPFTHVEKAWLIRNDPALVAAIDRELARELESGRWRHDLEAVR